MSLNILAVYPGTFDPITLGHEDLVLLDPPFESPHYETALKAAARALGPQGFVYLEAATAWNDEALAPLGLALHRHLKAGAVHAHLLRALG